MIYFCSDTHLGHNNVLRFDKKRGEKFSSIEEHDMWILKQLQSLTENDELYFLGDLVWKIKKEYADFLHPELEKIKAKMYMIRGNHDYQKIVDEYERHFEWVKHYHEIKYNKHKICLMHYPIQSWNRMYKGGIHLHGHSHQNLHREIKGVKWKQWLLKLGGMHHLFKPKNRYDISYDGGRLLRDIDCFINN